MLKNSKNYASAKLKFWIEMEIAICGQSLPPFENSILKKAYEIGSEIASKNCILRFGGCNGYPYEAAKGAFENNGKVVAISPAKNREEHVNAYNFPIDNFTEIDFTGFGIPGRNIPLVVNSDAVVLISGQIGTLNEFTIAFHQRKIIGILEESGGITSLIKQISEICKKVGEEDKFVYDSSPKNLIERISNSNNQ